jgi:hypothetical protein
MLVLKSFVSGKGTVEREGRKATWLEVMTASRRQAVGKWIA